MTVVGVLGPLVVGADAQLVRGQLGRVLGVLAIAHGRLVPTSELAAWALGEPHRDAYDRVHVLVSRLRRLLRQEGIAQVATGPSGYRLDVPGLELDAVAFEAVVRKASRLSGESRAVELEDALALWRGPVADGLGLDDHPGCGRLTDLRWTVLEDLLAVELMLGSFRGGLDATVAGCRSAPHRERLVALTALALYRGGRQTEALELLRFVRLALSEERGLDPGGALQRLELAVLRHDVDAVAQELLATGGSAAEPALVRVPGRQHAAVGPRQSQAGAVGKVPRALSGLVGRSGEVDVLGELLETSRLVTLTGPGGVGKTRLAIELGTRLVASGDRRAWWCELAPVGEPPAVPSVIAGALGVVADADRTVVDALAEFLSPPGTTLLLDNCEHLIDAVAAIVEELCGRCPELVVVTTSRETLGISGESVYPVLPLGVDDAVALFTQRARAVEASFSADAATEDICRQLDGIPLALEMAAARLRSMRPVEIAERLDRRFRLLVGVRGSIGRQQTLRATVDWSHDLLSDREQRVFRRLAVFSGSFDLAAAEAVVADDELDAADVDDVLHSLVSKSLVVPDTRDKDRVRFSLLETMRQFAQEHLTAAAEGDRYRQSHAEYFGQFVATAGGGLRGPDEVHFADLVAIELANLRVAYTWGMERGDATLAFGAFAPLPPTSLADPTAHAMFEWSEPVMRLPGASTSPLLWPALLWLLARGANLQEFDAVHGCLAWVRTLPGADDRPQVCALAGMSNHARGNLPEASRWHGRASAGFTALGDEYHAVRSDALTLWCRTDDDTSDELEVLAERARALQNPFMTAFGLGAATCSPRNVLRDPQRALELLDEATAWGHRTRGSFAHLAFVGARILALTLLGDPSAVKEARVAVRMGDNLNQVAVPVGALSVAFALAGHHREAAELIGAASRSPTVYNPLVATPAVTEIWATTREVLGPAAFDLAVARGAERTYDELVSWLADALQEPSLVLAPKPASTSGRPKAVDASQHPAP